MTHMDTLLARNATFAAAFAQGDLPILPKMRTVILTCADARVDPCHIFGLDLGEVVVMRNAGGRVTDDALDEIATLAFMAAMIDGDTPGPFNLIVMQHTQCGAERFADPGFQAMIKQRLDIDVAHSAITDHDQDLTDDIARLKASDKIPAHVVATGVLYDIKTGQVTEVVAPTPMS
ncbi:carbonic anhydrase [Tateyamaria sp. SN3-11]|uniref:carbonic anhydrase n=1 Tax=Tateyamaria sp. SN3-11 TaxID=3092147 RepID=UPI0039EAEBFC